MTMREDKPVIAALVGLGWWGQQMASLVNAGGAKMHFVRGVDPNPDAAAFAGEVGAVSPLTWRKRSRIRRSKPLCSRHRIRCTGNRSRVSLQPESTSSAKSRWT